MDQKRVYLGRVPFSARRQDVEEFFRDHGKINDISLKAGFAFIQFDKSSDAQDAVEKLNGRSILGQRVTVEFARGTPRGGDAQRRDRSRSPARSSKRTRSNSPGRDRSGRAHSRSGERSRKMSRSNRSSSGSRPSSRQAVRDETMEEKKERSRSHSPAGKKEKKPVDVTSVYRSLSLSHDETTQRSTSHGLVENAVAVPADEVMQEEPTIDTTPNAPIAEDTIEGIEHEEEEANEDVAQEEPTRDMANVPIADEDNTEDHDQDEEEEEAEEDDEESSTNSSFYRSISRSASDAEPEEENDEWPESDVADAADDDAQYTNQKASMLDLPDEILYKISAFMRDPKCLRLRLTKALHGRIHALMDWQRMTLNISSLYTRLTLEDSKRAWSPQFLITDHSVGKGLARWAAWTYVPQVQIIIMNSYIAVPAQCEAVRAAFQFPAETLTVPKCDADLNTTHSIAQLDFATLLVISANIREVTIDHCVTSLEAVDLCVFWKALVKGGTKLQFFSCIVQDKLWKEFIKTCFKITVEEEDVYAQAMMFTTTPSLHSEKLYSHSSDFPSDIIHFAGNLKTEIEIKWNKRISFKTITAEEKTEMLGTLHEIKLNEPYALIEEY